MPCGHPGSIGRDQKGIEMKLWQLAILFIIAGIVVHVMGWNGKVDEFDFVMGEVLALGVVWLAGYHL